MIRKEQTDEEDLLAFIESGAGRIGKSVEIPSPEGRTASGWVALQGLKVQPEVFTMLEQLREHKLFRGKWKTGAQVAWSMIYLGLQSCYQFYSKSDEDWKSFRSNYMAMHNANQPFENEKRDGQLLLAARRLRMALNTYANKGTPFGRYKVWTTLDQAMKTREMVEDVKQFDLNMRNPGAPALDSQLVFDNSAGEYWEKLFPKVCGDLDENAADLIYTSLTTEYFEELEAARDKGHED